MGERVNQSPVVNAGSDLAVGLFSSVTLSGSVTDDGLPSAGVQIDWQQLSGPEVLCLPIQFRYNRRHF